LERLTIVEEGKDLAWDRGESAKVDERFIACLGG